MIDLRPPRCLFLACLACLGLATAAAQSNLQAYYSFDDGTVAESQGVSDADPEVRGNPSAACGIGGGSLLLDGVGDYLTIGSPTVTNLFENNDFVLSFWFHPTSPSPRQTIVRKAPECATNQAGLTIDYLRATNELEVDFVENPERRLGGPDGRIALNPDRCWQHFALARQGAELQLFLNGARVSTLAGASRFNISNAAPFEIGRAGCGATESNFGGFVDEVRIYRGTLSREQTEALYVPIDLIAPLERIVINAGEQLDLQVVDVSCAATYAWRPDATVVNGAAARRATVQPATTTRYFLDVGYDDSGCVATDSALVQVFDPDNFDCTQLLVPAAFSPNGVGPADNEAFGISNAATLQRFNGFEVYDRWGTQVFVAAAAADRWDGSFDGEAAPPGVYLWRVSYVCNGEELNRTGSVVLMR